MILHLLHYQRHSVCDVSGLVGRKPKRMRTDKRGLENGGFEIRFNCLSIDTLPGEALYPDEHYFQKFALLWTAALPNCQKMTVMPH